MIVRSMKESDFPRVKEIDSKAFFKVIPNLVKPRVRRLDNVKSLFDECGEEALVLEADGKVIGSMFCHVLGEFAWIGPLSIDPDYQKNGYSKEFIKAAIGRLKEKDVREIALQTMVDAPQNVSLYLKCGFQADYPIFVLTKEVENNMEHLLFEDEEQWSMIEFDCSMSNLEEEMNHYTIENDIRLHFYSIIAALEKNQTGKTILIKDEEGQIRGIGILKTTSSVEESLDFLNVAHLYTKEMDETHISLMMRLIEQYAVHLNLTSVRIGINGNDNLVINELFDNGYRLANLSQKMIYNQYCSSITNKLYGALLG
ncbi:MAG: GNAT family N-acetyltransferase [Lachnospiraceae bacterium]|nr:GNAT family N-acetyltransferase [Lachnospiraceae bacterium]